jgi:hypothetical protein
MCKCILSQSLAGIVDRALLTLYGTEKNGKTTLTKVLADLMGPPDDSTGDGAYYQNCTMGTDV